MQAGRVDQAHHAAHLAAQAARRHAKHMLEKTRENLGIAGAARLAAARVIKPRLMTGHRSLDLAQRRRSRHLAKQQRDQLAFGRETARQFAGPMFLHKAVEFCPENEFQNVAKNRIRMGYATDPFHVQLSRKTLDTIRMPCALASKIEPDSRGSSPGIPFRPQGKERGDPTLARPVKRPASSRSIPCR